MRTFFDTGVLVHLFDAGAPGRQEKTRTLLQQETSEGRVVLSTQVLEEFYLTVTERMAVPLGPETAGEALSELSRLPVIPVDPGMIRNAADRSHSESIPFREALIVEAALATGADRLFTEALGDGRRFEGLTVVNPFTLR